MVILQFYSISSMLLASVRFRALPYVRDGKRTTASVPSLRRHSSGSTSHISCPRRCVATATVDLLARITDAPPAVLPRQPAARSCAGQPDRPTAQPRSVPVSRASGKRKVQARAKAAWTAAPIPQALAQAEWRRR